MGHFDHKSTKSKQQNRLGKSESVSTITGQERSIGSNRFGQLVETTLLLTVSGRLADTQNLEVEFLPDLVEDEIDGWMAPNDGIGTTKCAAYKIYRHLI